MYLTDPYTLTTWDLCLTLHNRIHLPKGCSRGNYSDLKKCRANDRPALFDENGPFIQFTQWPTVMKHQDLRRIWQILGQTTRHLRWWQGCVMNESVFREPELQWDWPSENISASQTQMDGLQVTVLSLHYVYRRLLLPYSIYSTSSISTHFHIWHVSRKRGA